MTDVARAPAPGLLIGYYGDDFTGSTDVMEALERAGLRTVLFLEPPTTDALARFPGARAVGIAGMSRTMSPEAMDVALPPAFAALSALRPRVVHYKICSTFDSSPTVGSVGRAIEIGRRVVADGAVPLVVGAPVLRRWCLFGQLFAGAGPDVFRLDRHPTMSRHPVTPMDEADLRVHLGRQTSLTIGLMDAIALGGARGDIDAAFARVVDARPRPDVVLFDVLDEPRLAETGRLIWSMATRARQSLFTVGSSGLEYALVAHWRQSGDLGAPLPTSKAAARDVVAVVSGSCSPATADQITHAIEHDGFVGVDVDAAALLDPARRDRARVATLAAATDAFDDGHSVVLYSARGPGDARVSAAETAWRDAGAIGPSAGVALGAELGRLARALVDARPLRRVVLAGGDTSGHGARALGIDALEMLAPAAPGSPLCRASSRNPRVDGLEIVLKGGQVGPPDFFERVRTGRFA